MIKNTDEPNQRAIPTQGTGRPKAADTPVPEVALLSNGQYSVMITAAGAGVSSWRDLDVTRWREDSTRDCWGQFAYVRDLSGSELWSIGHQPLSPSPYPLPPPTEGGEGRAASPYPLPP